MEKKVNLCLLKRKLKWLASVLLMLALLRWPEAMLTSGQQAMKIWYYSVAPAIFPFMALTPLITCREAVEIWEKLLGCIMKKGFNLSGAAAPAMMIAMLSGSPTGAIAARKIAAQNGMNQGELKKLAVAVCGMSPAFLVTGVGAGMLKSPGDGVKLMLSQLFAQLSMLIILQNAWKNQNEPVLTWKENIEEQPVRAATASVLTVCGYMMLFSGFACVSKHLMGGKAGDFLLCLLDAPSGSALIASLYMKKETKLIMLSALTGFGGGCIGAQNLMVLKDCGLSAVNYFALKMLSAGLAAFYMSLELRLNLKISPKNLPGSYIFALICVVIMAFPALFQAKNLFLNKEIFDGKEEKSYKKAKKTQYMVD